MPCPLHPRATESETTLIIVSARPEQIRDNIVALATVGEFTLAPGGTIEYEDFYFDTPARELRTHRWALRIRSGMGGCLFALKGPSRRTEWGGVERIEIEAAWSEEASRRISDELTSRGVAVPVPPAPDPNIPPVGAMKQAGFQVIQARRTRRDLKLVLRASGGEALAELVVDLVRYSFLGREFWHWELEIEAKSPVTAAQTQALADLFLAEYSPELRRWNHGKLLTGLVLAKLLQAGMLEGLVRPDNTLTAAAYDRLEQYLNRSDDL
ncbi:MAG: CYTH domain-containing protein [Desulfomonile tiedjei]|nr:CYTH domain-containing protein [Desulfomonile tiedjei]